MTCDDARERHVLIFASAAREETPYDEWAPDDVRLHVLVPEHLAAGYAHLPDVHAFADYRTSGTVEIAALAIARRVRPCAVMARGEVDVLRAARLRDMLDIPGQRWDSAVAFRDKAVMKRLLAADGIEVPAFAELYTALDVIDFVERHGLPVVVKPTRGSGSLGTIVIRSDEELRALLDGELAMGLEVEAFVSGSMYIVDGIVHDSQIAFLRTSKYINGCLAFRSGDFMGIRQLDQGEAFSQRLEALARRVLDCLPTPAHTVFHLEVWHTPDDRLVVCEIASRTGGARIKHTLSYAYGVDPDRESFRAQIGAEPAWPPPGRLDPAGGAVGHMLIYPRAGVLKALPTERPPAWVVGEKVAGVVGQRYDAGQKCGDLVASYIVAAPTANEVEARFEEIARWFDERTRWSTEASGALAS
jgi:hypothetical protein